MHASAPQILSLSEETLWQAILNRDTNFDGKLFYGVRSTNIYCRPTCPSRKPNRSQVTFFNSPEAAENKGFRPCKRCHPQNAIVDNPARDKVIAACRYIETECDLIPTLSEIGDRVAMSPTHLQRIFKQIVGISPFQYADSLRIKRLKEHLREGEEIAPALYEVGYGSSSRLYEKAPKQLGMTPNAYKHLGCGEEIHYVIANSPLGFVIVAATKRGICNIRLGNNAAEIESDLQREFSNASLEKADPELSQWMQSLIDYLSGNLPLPNLPCDVKATAFQLQVWNALQAIPAGTTVTYSDVADAIGKPKSVRAVARACATNPVALVIPCHRVVPKSGGVGGYRWGSFRKEKLIDLEKESLCKQ